jgi:protein kinase A
MPTFGGLLKKVRTKDPSSKNQDGPTSPSKPQPADSSTTQASSVNSSSTAATPSATTTFAKATQQDSAVGPQDSLSPATAIDDPMASGHASPQSHGVASANTPSIQNLLNSDEKSANGGVAALPSQQTPSQPRTTKGKYTLPDFTIQRTLGTGSFGRVHLVQSKHNQRFYAIKVLKKAQVVKMKQVEHTNDERRMLQAVKHPFLITLWGTFQDSKNLYMVMDFVEGGELFSLLRKSQVRGTITHPYRPMLTLYSDFPTPSPNSTRPK